MATRKKNKDKKSSFTLTRKSYDPRPEPEARAEWTRAYDEVVDDLDSCFDLDNYVLDASYLRPDFLRALGKFCREWTPDKEDERG